MRVASKLDRYVSSYFISSYVICFIFFLGLFVVIDLVSRVDEFIETAPLAAEKGKSIFWMVTVYYLMKGPEIFLMVAPYLTVMSAMFCISRLKKYNEVVPMIMSGVSAFRILQPIFIMAGMLLVGMILIQEYVAPFTAKHRMLTESFIIRQRDQLIIDRQAFRDRDGRQIVVSHYNVATQVIGNIDVSYLEQESAQEFNYSIKGKNLRWLPEEHGWSIEEGLVEKVNFSDPDANPERTPIKIFKSDLTPADIFMSIKQPSEMSFKEIQRQYALNPLDRRWKILLHYHITFPFSNILLLLLGIPFVLRPDTRSNFLGLTIALFICGGYFVLDVVMRDLGTKNHIHPIVAAWTASIFCGALGIYLFDNIKT